MSNDGGGRRGSTSGGGDRGGGRGRDQRSSGGNASQGRGRNDRSQGRGGSSRANERGTPPPKPRPSGLDVPGTAGEPIGRDRAAARSGAPPRPATDRDVAPPRPDLPVDEEPQLPRAVRREIDRALGSGPRSHDIALALSIGAAAIDEDRPDVAVEVLSWARHQAPKLAPIREALGVAHYLRDEFAPALSELQAYRRISGRDDQNHLAADCLRALDRGVDRIAEVADPLIADEHAPDDRRAEAVIVRSASLAEADDVPAARAIARRFLERPRDGDEEYDLRVRYLAADLAERAGDHAAAARQLEMVVAVDPDLFDAEERLEGLRDRGY